MPIPLAIALGGALGALARFSVDRALERRFVSVVPWSTLTVNVTGCLVIGMLAAGLIDRPGVPAWVRVGTTIGLVGGYTTFSTYAQESLALLEEGRLGLAVAYAFGSVALGVAGVFLGIQIGRAV